MVTALKTKCISLRYEGVYLIYFVIDWQNKLGNGIRGIRLETLSLSWSGYIIGTGGADIYVDIIFAKSLVLILLEPGASI
jgi:hypothetical protein